MNAEFAWSKNGFNKIIGQFLMYLVMGAYGTCIGVWHQRVTTGQYSTGRRAQRRAVHTRLHRRAVQVAVALQRNLVLDTGKDADVESQTRTVQPSVSARRRLRCRRQQSTGFVVLSLSLPVCIIVNCTEIHGRNSGLKIGRGVTSWNHRFL